MQIWLVSILLLGLAAPAGGFVSKLGPYGGQISCHQLKFAVRSFIQGHYTAGQLQDALKAHYLTPIGEDWSAEDLLDNQNLLDLVESKVHANPDQQRFLRYEIADNIESQCAAAEQQFLLVGGPADFRALLGLPPVP